MGLISYFRGDALSVLLRRSNYWAKQNRNGYPLKIYKAVSDLYEWVDCPCDDKCECRKYQCKKHLVRKQNLDFDIHHNHFLGCYVDFKSHEAVRQRTKSGRASAAIEASDKIRNKWKQISAISSTKHLLCSNWCEPAYESLAGFRVGSGTIYDAKWLSLLSFDTFAAYDTKSVDLLKRDFKKPTDYLTLMNAIRQDIVKHLDDTGATLQDFRQYDNPSEFFGEIPKDRPKPLGNIIDKLYLTL